MHRPRTHFAARSMLMLGVGLMLQGCIAAAIPIAAGGVIGERELSRDKDKEDDTTTSRSAPPEQVANSDLAPIPSDIAPPGAASSEFPDLAPSSPPQAAQSRSAFARAPEIAGSALPPAEAITANTPPPALTTSAVGRLPEPLPTARAPEPAAPLPSAAPASNTAELASGLRPLPTPIPSVRAPLSEPIAAPAAPGVIPTPPQAQPRYASAGVNQLLSYANNRQIGSEGVPESAMLSNRIALTPERAECGGISPTVLIDLDPEGGMFDSNTASRPPSGLARGLNQLRQNGVSIAWISGNGIDKLTAISRSLRYSGLDLNNEDRVLLVRGDDDRKQSLREELAQISCLIAIAGDTRSDFDELYDYLKNPADAESLEPLIGDGWFLIPQPLIASGAE